MQQPPIIDDRALERAAKHPTTFKAWVIRTLLNELVEYRKAAPDLGTDPIQALYDVASGGEVSALDELVQRAELHWKCETCGWINTSDEDTCENCEQDRESSE